MYFSYVYIIFYVFYGIYLVQMCVFMLYGSIHVSNVSNALKWKNLHIRTKLFCVHLSLYKCTFYSLHFLPDSILLSKNNNNNIVHKRIIHVLKSYTIIQKWTQTETSRQATAAMHISGSMFYT